RDRTGRRAGGRAADGGEQQDAQEGGEWTHACVRHCSPRRGVRTSRWLGYTTRVPGRNEKWRPWHPAGDGVEGTGMAPTHEVLNQPPPLEGYDLFATDRVLGEGVEREGAGWARDRLTALGVIAGGAPLEWGRLANANPPVLRTHDRFGHRI